MQVVWRALGGRGGEGWGGGAVLEACIRGALGHAQLTQGVLVGGAVVKGMSADMLSTSVCLKVRFEAACSAPKDVWRRLAVCWRRLFCCAFIFRL